MRIKPLPVPRNTRHPPLRVRLGYLYTAGTASSMSWRVTQVPTTHSEILLPCVRVSRSTFFCPPVRPWRLEEMMLLLLILSVTSL